MNQEYFKILREISSLDAKILELGLIRQKEEKRIAFIESNREEAMVEMQELEVKLGDLRKENSHFENEIDGLNRSIEKVIIQLTTEQGANIADKLEASKDHYNHQKNQMEESYFQNLETIEQTADLIDQKKNFLKGSLDSLKEISQEVYIFSKKNLSEITNIQERINNLKLQLPDNFQEVYQKTMSLNLKISPFAKIINGTCDVCKMTVASPIRDSVEKNFQLKTCSSCRRIFLPYASL